MKITRRDFEWAVDRGLIDAGTADKLWKALAAHVEQRPRFDLTHVAYYAGALVVILAMTWFMTQAWQRYGGLGLLILRMAAHSCSPAPRCGSDRACGSRRVSS